MSDELLAQIDRMIKERPLYKAALSEYRELLSLLEEVQPEKKDVTKDEALTEIKVREGFPLFSREDLPLDLKVASSLFPRLLDHLSSKKRKDKEALKRTLDRIHADPQWIERAISAFLRRDEDALTSMAQTLNLEPIVLRFLATMALKPSLNALRESVSGRIQKHRWDYGYCPLCGSFPDMAYFDDNGKRMLHCELCGHEWNYPRLKCPFCENSEHKELGYFVIDEEKGFRVDYCKKCKVYIKTLDVRAVEIRAPLELENLITLHLDMLAHEQGFKTHSD